MNNVLISETQFLREVLRASETEPIDVQAILGASGIEHPIVAAGIDPARKRMVVVSETPDPKAAALMLADLQVSFKAVQIVLARVADEPSKVEDALNDILL